MSHSSTPIPPRLFLHAYSSTPIPPRPFHYAHSTTPIFQAHFITRLGCARQLAHQGTALPCVDG
jgi:hypothetical protein